MIFGGLSAYTKWRRRFSRTEWAARHFGFAVSQDPPHARGLLLIQIDGLARVQMERALKAGKMPFLRRLLRRHGHQCHTFYSGLPASTPAVQGELHYGVRTAVPAFSFLDREAGSIRMMFFPSTAKKVEARLAENNEGLLRGGSSWSNIYTGGAAPEESHFCAASIDPSDTWRSVRLRLLGLVALLYPDSILRLLGLLVLELGIGIWDALRGVFRESRSWRKEFTFLVARVAVCVGLREIVTLGAAIDVARGLPVVHVNFVGYDEQSHRRGPDSAFAHWALRGIDRAIEQLHRAARRSQRREYDVWIFSDHGQTACRQATHQTPGGLEALVRRHWPDAPAGTPAPGRAQSTPSPLIWFGGRAGDRREARQADAAKLSAFEREQFAIAALGPVGHIYFGRPLGPDTARRLAAALVRDGVPGILWRDGADGAVWLEAGGEHRLPRDAALLDGDESLRPELARDLAALCQHPAAGDLVALGWSRGKKSWSFAAENGAHAGPSPHEVNGFALFPPATWLPEGTEHHIRPGALRQAALHLLGRDRHPPRDTVAAPLPSRALGHDRHPGRDTVAAPHPSRALGGDRHPGRDTVAAPLPSRALGSDPASHPSTPPARSSRRRLPRTAPLRVITYNVHGCAGSDGRISPGRVARVLEDFDADLIALQELDIGRSRSRAEDQVALIADELGLHARFCTAVTHGAGRYGHALLSRVPLELVREGPLPGSTGWFTETRAALWVTLTWQGRTLQVLATHLGVRGPERRNQIEALLGPDWLGAIPADQPVILCGDLNLHPGSPGYRRLASRLRDSQAHIPGHIASRTFPAVYPIRRLDYVFVSPHFNVTAAWVPRDALTTVTSDHLPLICDLAPA